MIFVTVGTHEQPFNRLVEYIDKIKGGNIITDNVVIQTGYSTYEPKHCTWKKFYSYSEMRHYINEARIVITHGGPSSFIMPLQIGKTPIVVPRIHKYNEHINNHQVTFCNTVAERMGTIIVVEDIEKLGEIVNHYNEIVTSMPLGLKSNNINFCKNLNKLVEELFQPKNREQ